MKKLLAGSLGIGMLLFTGCLSAPFQPPMGAFTSIEAPLSVDHSKTLITTKQGESSSICIVGLIAVGDASAHTAAQNGGLKVLHYMDYEYFNLLGIFQKTTVIAHGE